MPEKNYWNRKMIPEAELILAIAKESIYGQKFGVEGLIKQSRIDWQWFKGLCETHELQSFIYPIIKEFGPLIPEEVLESFKKVYFRSLVSSQYLWKEFLGISDKFKEKGVVLAPIKGVSFLADIYASAPSRLMTDIDLLIKEEDLRAGKEILHGLGYTERLDGLKEEYWLKKQCHLQFIKKQSKIIFYVDMHFGLDFKRNNGKILPQLWERLREVNIDGRDIKLLSPEDDFFSLALHLRRFGKILGLKNAFDAASILYKHKNNFDWDYLLQEAKKGRICSTIFFMLRQAELFFEADIPKPIWEALNIPLYKRSLVKQLLKSTFSLDLEKRLKKIYLKSHFLLYDNLCEPFDYILNIPQEQFAKFYGLKAYDRKTSFFYQNRIFYIPFKAITNLIQPKAFYNKEKCYRFF